MRHPSIYAALVVAHVAAAVLGFGYVALSGVYASTARHPERPGASGEAARFFSSRAAAEWALLAVPVLGLAAVVVAGDAGQAWVAVAMVLWALSVVVVLAVARPARARVRSALGEVGRSEAGDRSRQTLLVEAARLGRAAAAVDVLAVLAVLDMVYKPGH